MLWRDLWLNEWAPEFDNSKSANNHRHGKIYECNFTMPHISTFTWQASILSASTYKSSFMPRHGDKNVQLCLLLFPLVPTIVSMTSHFKYVWYAMWQYLFDLYKVLFYGILPEFSILRPHFADAFKSCDVFEMHIFLLERFICFLDRLITFYAVLGLNYMCRIPSLWEWCPQMTLFPFNYSILLCYDRSLKM